MPQKSAHCRFKIKSRAGTEVESVSGCLWLQAHSGTALLQVFNIPFGVTVPPPPLCVAVCEGSAQAPLCWGWQREAARLGSPGTAGWKENQVLSLVGIESMSNQLPEDQNEGSCCHLFRMSCHRMFIERVKLSTANFTTHVPTNVCSFCFFRDILFSPTRLSLAFYCLSPLWL